MSAPLARLGPFELVEAIGEGGMGTVFRAVHVLENVEVAVKVVSGNPRDTRALAAFRREVRAVAALSHGNIVSVVDHDLIPQHVVTTDPRIAPGSPYFVMELAEATLRERPPAPHWTAVRSVLLQLLDALAFAHAHGIVHRDLKPPNILWVRSGEGRVPRIKLSDFGLAHALATDAEFGRGAGTPAYMAPEQFRAHARDFGPWTDLYAVGCIAYWLVTGRRVFEERDEVVLAQRHLHDPPPPLQPKFAVPEELERWIRRLLEKNPLRRYRFAADAAYVLERLAGSSTPPPADGTSSYVTTRAELLGEQSAPFLAENLEGRVPHEGPVVQESDTTPTLDGLPGRRAREHDSSSQLKALVAKPQKPLDPDAFEPDAHKPPPLPLTWRRVNEPVVRPLLGAGLGLFGLRGIPLVGRVRERDFMWRALADVGERRRPHAIVLSGGSGIGKTALAEWFERRAHEVGAAHTMSASHERGARGRRTLVDMVRSHLGVRGLDWAGTSQRVRQYMAAHGVRDDHERRALADLVAPSGSSERSGQRLVPMVTEHALIARVLERACRDRPLVVRLEDAQWSNETLAFVERALDESRLPVLFVLTVQDDAVDADPHQRLRGFLRRLDVVHLPIAPLPDPDHEVLVRSLLFLGPELADDVVRRTAGNPLFAREVVRDWVERGLLRITDQGFALGGSNDVEVPDDLHTHFRILIQRVVDPATDELAALELAALAGARIDPAEWRLACELAEIGVTRGFLDRLLAHRVLVQSDPRGLDTSLRFAHGLLRESVERSAREGGRFASLHRALAEMLLPRFETGELDVAERLSFHERAAGRYREALGPLRAAFGLATARAEYERALDLLGQHGTLAASLGEIDGDVERVENRIGTAEVRAATGELDLAAELAMEGLTLARRVGREDLVARAMSAAGYVESLLARTASAEALLAEALQRFDRIGRAAEAARCLRGLAEIAAHEGRTEVAFQAHLAALEHARTAGDEIGIAASLVGMGLTDPTEPRGSESSLLEALEIGEREGHFATVIAALSALGEVARRHHRASEAESRFRRARDLAESLGATPAASLARVSLALVLFEHARLREARELVGAELARLEDARPMPIALFLHALALAADAKLASGRSLRHHAWATRELLTAGVIADTESVALLEIARDVPGLDARDQAELALLVAQAQDGKPASPRAARSFFVRG